MDISISEKFYNKFLLYKGRVYKNDIFYKIFIGQSGSSNPHHFNTKIFNNTDELYFTRGLIMHYFNDINEIGELSYYDNYKNIIVVNSKIFEELRFVLNKLDSLDINGFVDHLKKDHQYILQLVDLLLCRKNRNDCIINEKIHSNENVTVKNKRNLHLRILKSIYLNVSVNDIEYVESSMNLLVHDNLKLNNEDMYSKLYELNLQQEKELKGIYKIDVDLSKVEDYYKDAHKRGFYKKELAKLIVKHYLMNDTPLIL